MSWADPLGYTASAVPRSDASPVPLGPLKLRGCEARQRSTLLFVLRNVETWIWTGVAILVLLALWWMFRSPTV